MDPKEQLYQTVILTLSDGREVRYSGPAQVQEETGLKVINVVFTTPKKLPKGTYFEEV